MTRLDVEAFLVELLDRVRDVIHADTAAILLLEAGTQDLVARAARGIEEEVYQGVRVPLRTGFAGRIAAERRPVVLDRVDDTTVANPILWEKGIRTMLGVPLLVGDNLMGVLHVGRLGKRLFTTGDAELLGLVAERVAFAAQTRLLQVESAASKLLERSLLPRSLPDCDGLEIAVRYATANGRDRGATGTTYSSSPPASCRVITGDVAGHGLSAAVIMGRLRSTVRAYALLGRSCEDVIALTNRKLMHFEFGETATVLCATSTPPYTEFHVFARPDIPLPSSLPPASQTGWSTSTPLPFGRPA